MPALHSALIKMDLQLMRIRDGEIKKANLLASQAYTYYNTVCCSSRRQRIMGSVIQRGENRAEERLHMSEIL